MEPEKFALVSKAAEVCARFHDGQYRKDPTLWIPYTSHPTALALLLSSHGFPPTLLAAALCHDLVEDTSATLDTIRDEVSPTVAELVEWVTEPKRDTPWEERKASYRAKLADAPIHAVALSLADKIHNLQSLLDSLGRVDEPEAVWSVFSRGPHKSFEGYRLLREVFRRRAVEDTRVQALLAHYDNVLAKLELQLPPKTD